MISVQFTFFSLSFQVGFMTGPRPMTPRFISVAAASCWEASSCCWPPCLPGTPATSCCPGRLQPPFCTKCPPMFRGRAEGTADLSHGRIALWLTLNEFFFFFNKSRYSLRTVYVASISCIYFFPFCVFPRSGTLLFYYHS